MRIKRENVTCHAQLIAGASLWAAQAREQHGVEQELTSPPAGSFLLREMTLFTYKLQAVFASVMSKRHLRIFYASMCLRGSAFLFTMMCFVLTILLLNLMLRYVRGDGMPTINEKKYSTL